MAKTRPGVMLYFDIRPALRRLTSVDKGELFEAILEYGQYGVLPEFEGVLGVAWDFIQPRIDADAERYNQISQVRSQAATKSHARAANAANENNSSNELTVQPTSTQHSSSSISTTTTPTEANAGTGVAGGEPLYKPPSDQEFENLRQAAFEKLMKGRENE